MITRTMQEDDATPRVDRVDHLYLAIDATSPRGGARYALTDIDEVVIGRGDRVVIERGDRRLIIERPDPWMSVGHARLARERAHWIVEDTGSRNGVLVRGVRQPRSIVLDGDVVELGRTLLVLREGEPAAEPDLKLEGEAGALRTLDPRLAAHIRELERVSAAALPILITGPSGAGKERAARFVHDASGRAGAFVAVNCAALPDALIESELFGHRRGSFSGAVDHHQGLIAAASGGTLFLDEIGDLAPSAQAALLRALEEREIRAVGATTSEPVDLRVVAATHRDLDAMVTGGGFREDLLARLVGFTFALPPLSERRVDLGLMLGEILPEGTTLAASAARAVLRYDWPRNARELVQAMERARALAESGEIRLADLPAPIAAAATAPSPIPSADDEQRAQLVALLEKHNGNVTRVAAELGRVRSQVQRWIKRHGIDAARYR